MAKEKNLKEETTEVVTDPEQSTNPEGTINPEQSTNPEGTIDPEQSTNPEGTIDPEGTTDPEGSDGEEVEDETEEGGIKVLVAVYPILFLSHQYNVGDVLPTNYQNMVDAWLEAGTAVWKDSEALKANAVKARPKTAEPGLPGVAAASESEDNLAGKVPKTAGRKKK